MVPGSAFPLLLRRAPAASVPAVNWALASNGGVMTSVDFDGAYPPALANNGDRRGVNYSFWRNAWYVNYPIWLQVTLSSPQPIREINVFTTQSGGDFHSPQEPTQTMTTANDFGAFNLEYLVGSTWTVFPGGNVPNNNLVWKRLTLATPVTAAAVRVYWPSGSTSYQIKDICEFEVWT